MMLDFFSKIKNALVGEPAKSTGEKKKHSAKHKAKVVKEEKAATTKTKEEVKKKRVTTHKKEANEQPIVNRKIKAVEDQQRQETAQIQKKDNEQQRLAHRKVKMKEEKKKEVDLPTTLRAKVEKVPSAVKETKSTVDKKESGDKKDKIEIESKSKTEIRKKEELSITPAKDTSRKKSQQSERKDSSSEEGEIKEPTPEKKTQIRVVISNPKRKQTKEALDPAVQAIANLGIQGNDLKNCTQFLQGIMGDDSSRNAELLEEIENYKESTDTYSVEGFKAYFNQKPPSVPVPLSLLPSLLLDSNDKDKSEEEPLSDSLHATKQATAVVHSFGNFKAQKTEKRKSQESSEGSHSYENSKEDSNKESKEEKPRGRISRSGSPSSSY